MDKSMPAIIHTNSQVVANQTTKQITIEQSWSVRALDRQGSVMYYERLLSSRDRPAVEQEAKEKLSPWPITKTICVTPISWAFSICLHNVKQACEQLDKHWVQGIQHCREYFPEP